MTTPIEKLRELSAKWRKGSDRHREDSKDKDWARSVAWRDLGLANALATCADELDAALSDLAANSRTSGLPEWVKTECLEVLRNVDTELSATGRISDRVRRLINLIAGVPVSPAPNEQKEAGGQDAKCDCGANPDNKYPHHDECAIFSGQGATKTCHSSQKNVVQRHVVTKYRDGHSEVVEITQQPARGGEFDYVGIANKVQATTGRSVWPSTVKAILNEALAQPRTEQPEGKPSAWLFDHMHVVQFSDQEKGIEGNVEWCPDCRIDYPHELLKHQWARNVRPLYTRTPPRADVVDDLKEQVRKLQAFKYFVHRRLDEAGIPVDPPGAHRDAGCRIGQRLDIALAPAEVDEAMVERGLDAKPFVDENKPVRVWQLICEESADDRRKVMRAALTAALNPEKE